MIIYSKLYLSATQVLVNPIYSPDLLKMSLISNPKQPSELSSRLRALKLRIKLSKPRYGTLLDKKDIEL